jgi:hypothetical protein
MWPLYLGVAVTAILFVIGGLFSYTTKDWTIFSRVGSLIVILGLLIAKWDLDNLIKSKIPLNLIEDLIHVNAKKLIPNKQLSESDIAEIKEKTHLSIVEDIKPKYRSGEIYIVSLGTLIWGFGDLVQKIHT